MYSQLPFERHPINQHFHLLMQICWQQIYTVYFSSVMREFSFSDTIYFGTKVENPYIILIQYINNLFIVFSGKFLSLCFSTLHKVIIDKLCACTCMYDKGFPLWQYGLSYCRYNAPKQLAL